MTTLYLTAHEQSLFDALPGEVKEGWTVEEESLTYHDTPAKQELRLALLKIHDPKLVAFREEMQKAQTIDEVVRHIHDMDLSDVDEDDLASLFFAIGPTYLSGIIEHLLAGAKTDSDVEGITALTVIRHSILEAFHTVSTR